VGARPRIRIQVQQDATEESVHARCPPRALGV
jgi:hypothetical protein